MELAHAGELRIRAFMPVEIEHGILFPADESDLVKLIADRVNLETLWHDFTHLLEDVMLASYRMCNSVRQELDDVLLVLF